MTEQQSIAGDEEPALRGSDTAATLDSVTGSGQASSEPAVVIDARAPIHPYVHVVVVAVVGAVAVLAWLLVYTEGSRLLWGNAFVQDNPWMFAVICLPLSALVGLLIERFDAPNNIDGSALESLMGDPSRIDWRRLPISIVTPLVSLFSGAVVGPEGGIGGIAAEISAWYADRVRLPAAHRGQVLFSTMAAAYNGLIANPLFTGVLGSELTKDQAARAMNLPANLLGGAIGYIVFLAVGYQGLGNYLHLQPSQPFAVVDVVVVLGAGMLGLVLAIVAGACFRVAATVFGRFGGRPVVRALLAGAIFSVVGTLAPILMFSGEEQVGDVVADPAGYGVAVLLAMAVVKIALLAVGFKSGFFGGPTFPAIFASVCVGMAVGLMLPGVRVDVLIGGVMAGFLVVLFRAPFMTILLTAFMLQASTDLLALIVIAVAAVLIVQPYLLAAIAARQAARSARAGGPAG